MSRMRSSKPRSRNIASPPDLSAHALGELLRIVGDPVAEDEVHMRQLFQALVGLPVDDFYNRIAERKREEKKS